MGIGLKVNAAILGMLIFGFGAVTAFFGTTLVSVRRTLNRTALVEEADIIVASVENFMLPGEAPIAIRFFEDIAVRNPQFRVALYRADGSGAFADGKTAAEVNQRIGLEKFPTTSDGRPAFPSPEASAVSRGTGMPPESSFLEVGRPSDGAERRFVDMYRPLINLPKCVSCHGGDHTVRGVLRVSTDVTDSIREQQASIVVSGGIFVLMVALVGAILARFMKRTVVAPVTAIGEQCRRVTAGDFSGIVPYREEDEIGALAETVNRMTEGLRERFELSKYVSGSTISAIRGDQRGRRDHRVLLFSDIRGFTSISEEREAEEVVALLNRALDIQSAIVAAYRGDVDKFVGDEVLAVFSGPGAEKRACAAALDMHREIGSAFGEAGHPLSVGIGIAAGQVIHGMIGSSSRADFTVIGDPVNTAARLCAAAKPGVTLVHASAAQAVLRDGEFLFSGPYGAALKGKKEKQAVYMLERRIEHA